MTQEGSPLTDARVRCAMAYATDEQAIIDKVEAGVPKIANGPFSPAQVGNMDDSGYPVKQDMAKAKSSSPSYKAENPGPLNISLSTTQDATNLVIAQAQQEFFEAGRLRRRADQSDRAGQVHPDGAAGQLPGLPVA